MQIIQSFPKPIVLYKHKHQFLDDELDSYPQKIGKNKIEPQTCGCLLIYNKNIRNIKMMFENLKLEKVIFSNTLKKRSWYRLKIDNKLFTYPRCYQEVLDIFKLAYNND